MLCAGVTTRTKHIFCQAARKPPGSLRVIPVFEILLHSWISQIYRMLL